MLSGAADAVGSDDRLPQEMEVAILRELAEGRTDEAISRRLGISSRTLRRYLSAMLEPHSSFQYWQLETFGVDTRFQLGMAAVRHGVIAVDEGVDADPSAG